MTRTRALLAAALAGAAVTTAPASAAPSEVGQDFVYTVATSGTGQLLGTDRLDARCVFRPDRWTADYGPTAVTGVATTNGAVFTTVRCELYSHDELAGAVSGSANAPVATTSDSVGPVGSRPYIEVCVSAEAQFPTTYVTAERRCIRP